MGDVVNLNKYRKHKTRETSAKEASENRVKFGRTKGQKQKEKQEADSLSNNLSGNKIVEKDSGNQKPSDEDQS